MATLPLLPPKVAALNVTICTSFHGYKNDFEPCKHVSGRFEVSLSKFTRSRLGIITLIAASTMPDGSARRVQTNSNILVLLVSGAVEQ